MPEPPSPPSPQEQDARLSRVESAVAALTATVTSLAEEWKTERADMRSTVSALRESAKTSPTTIIGWVSMAALVGGMAGGLVVREIDHVQSEAELRSERSNARLGKLETVTREDHDETVKNAERWRLLETGILRPPASWRLLEQSLFRGLPVHIDPKGAMDESSPPADPD